MSFQGSQSQLAVTAVIKAVQDSVSRNTNYVPHIVSHAVLSTENEWVHLFRYLRGDIPP